MHEPRRPRARRVAGVAVLVATMVACGSGDEAQVDVGPTAPRAHEDPETITTALAPSQVTAATVVRPDTPPRCEPSEIAIWTAAVDIVPDRATAILRVRNDGAVWCEIDLRGSPRIDPRTEPDLWLEPGEWGELWVGADESATCDEPKAVQLADVAVVDEVRSVPTAAVVPCDWTILALFGAEAPSAPCDGPALAMVRVDGRLALRNQGSGTCTLGELVSVDGVEVATGGARPGLPVAALGPGDTVAFPLRRGADGCDPIPAVVRFSSGAAVDVAGLSSCDVVVAGLGEPFYGGPAGPLAGFPSVLDSLELVAALVALDPFAGFGRVP